MGVDTDTGVRPHRHAVKFYDSDGNLLSTLAGFVEDGLMAGQPALVIASADHRNALVDELERRNIRVASARRRGDLVLLDARETLDLFLVNGQPSPHLFLSHMGALLKQIVRGRGRTIARAYAGMVDVLCQDGLTDAAIELEMLWNQLARKHGFALLCAYALSHFENQAHRFAEVCRQHSHIFQVAHVGMSGAGAALQSALSG